MSSYLFEPPFARSRAIALEAAMKEAEHVVQPEPVAPANVVEALKQMEPVVEEPVAEEPVAEEPVVEEPVVEEPVVEEPVAEEPVAEEPVVEEPVVEEPVVEEPVVEEPVVEEPVVEEPVVEEPVVEEPVVEEPDKGWDATMLKPELLAIAEERGLDLPEKPLKSDIIKALEQQE